MTSAEDRNERKPDQVNIEKLYDGEIGEIGIILFDDENREHHIWFENTGSEYELYKHKTPLQHLSKEDTQLYEDIREKAEKIIKRRFESCEED